MPRARRAFTAADIRDRLSYDPITGLFRWKVRVMCQGGGRMPGDIAGTSKDGYVQIKLFGRVYRAHHIVWLLMTGDWPPASDIDHRNTDRSDNRWVNLRLATRSQNNLNSRVMRPSKSGHRGVHPCTNSDRWSARIGVAGRVIGLGTFDTREEAIAARQLAEKKHYDGFV
ncbi:hypothetical protein BI317_15805 [Xanthomonas hortorum pv. gardneri]|nr:hypothetical protein BI317_15805 [Xanthomonas hortorum pv. gardneri]